VRTAAREMAGEVGDALGQSACQGLRLVLRKLKIRLSIYAVRGTCRAGQTHGPAPGEPPAFPSPERLNFRRDMAKFLEVKGLALPELMIEIELEAH
jgi:hypothetical protein